MAHQCSRCSKSFKGLSGYQWHMENIHGTSRDYVPRKGTDRKKASPAAAQAKDVASDVTLVAAPSSSLLRPPKSPYAAYALSFDGDLLPLGHELIVSASSLEDAKKKAEQAWKAGRFGKAGDAMWAQTYSHRIGKGWYRR